MKFHGFASNALVGFSSKTENKCRNERPWNKPLSRLSIRFRPTHKYVIPATRICGVQFLAIIPAPLRGKVVARTVDGVPVGAIEIARTVRVVLELVMGWQDGSLAVKRRAARDRSACHYETLRIVVIVFRHCVWGVLGLCGPIVKPRVQFQDVDLAVILVSQGMCIDQIYEVIQTAKGVAEISPAVKSNIPSSIDTLVPEFQTEPHDKK